MKTYQRIAPTLALVLAVMGLCMGGAIAAGKLVITSANLKNNTVRSIDLRNSGIDSKDIGTNEVTATDIATSAVGTTDIATNAVTPSDVELPAPVALAPGITSGTVNTSAFASIVSAGAYVKVQPESTLEVSWAGVAGSGPATNCVFQVRVDGAEPTGGGGEVFTLGEPINVSTLGLFPGLPAGPHTIEVWAKASAYIGGGSPTCQVGGMGVDSTFVIDEQVQ